MVLEAGSRIFSAEDLARCYVVDYDLPPGPYAYLRVRDNGEGISEDQHPRIFDPFYSTRFPGRGLGLPTVLGIVRAHRGGVLVDSDPGAGTTVTVLLPLAPPVEPVVTRDWDAEESTGWRGSGKVLLVDDEHYVRSVGEAVLRYLGFEPLIAITGWEALELVDRGDPELRAVILDLSMPGLSGEETLRRLRQEHPSLPVVISSGYSEDEVSPALKSLGMAGFLQKPYRPSDLRRVLRRVLAE